MTARIISQWTVRVGALEIGQGSFKLFAGGRVRLSGTAQRGPPAAAGVVIVRAGERDGVAIVIVRAMDIVAIERELQDSHAGQSKLLA